MKTIWSTANHEFLKGLVAFTLTVTFELTAGIEKLAVVKLKALIPSTPFNPLGIIGWHPPQVLFPHCWHIVMSYYRHNRNRSLDKVFLIE